MGTAVLPLVMAINADFRKVYRFRDPNDRTVPIPLTGTTFRSQVRLPDGTLLADLGMVEAEARTGFFLADAENGVLVHTIMRDDLAIAAILAAAVPGARYVDARYDVLRSGGGITERRWEGKFSFDVLTSTVPA